MTTLEPGASVVFTHGRRCNPRSTAFLASRAAPIITDGLEVLVHDVMAAMVTAPWSSSNVVPSPSVTWAGLLDRPSAAAAACSCQSSGAPLPLPPACPLLDAGASLD